MIPKNLEAIVLTDIQLLIDEGRREDKTIEYKSQIPGNADSEKIPWLLKPVCSFANTSGGDLIFGINEREGLPQEFPGITLDNVDKSKLMLEHIIQSGIEPQIRGIHIKDVQLENGKYFLIVRIPQSWTSPHRVKNNSKFYARSSAGSYELDISQVRQSFLLTENLSQKLLNFRADRIAKIVGEEAPVNLCNGSRVILHLIPLSSISSPNYLAVSEYKDLFYEIAPISRGGALDKKLNFDGLIVTSGLEDHGYRAYTQLFRSGIIEFVRVYEPRERGLYIPSGSYEKDLLEILPKFLGIMKTFGYEPPIYLFLSLLGIKGYKLAIGQMDSFFNGDTLPFDRNILLLPDTEMESLDISAVNILKPLFDMIWNAAGYEKSLNFDENNNWRDQR